MTHAENQLAALIEAIELMTGINYGQRIEELEVRNAALLEALKAMFPYTDCQCYPRTEYEGECLGCGYEATRENAKQAIAQAGGERTG